MLRQQIASALERLNNISVLKQREACKAWFEEVMMNMEEIAHQRQINRQIAEGAYFGRVPKTIPKVLTAEDSVLSRILSTPPVVHIPEDNLAELLKVELAIQKSKQGALEKDQEAMKATLESLVKDNAEFKRTQEELLKQNEELSKKQDAMSQELNQKQDELKNMMMMMMMLEK